MAVFLLNVCKFNECGIQFPNLTDLIHHIEATHIDYDPKVVEQKELQQPACLPLSYVLRFITDATRKEPVPSPIVQGSALSLSTGNAAASNGLNGLANGNASGHAMANGNGGGNGNGGVGASTTAELKRKLAIKHHSYSISSSNRSNTPTGSEMDEEEMMLSQSEDSNDSWTTEEFSSEFIMRYGSRHSGGTGPNGTNEKPFACPVPGCKKRYKNVNGIKYHSKNGHKKDGKVRKGYKCHCGKSYKTASGLKNHSIQVHNTDNIQLTQVPIGGSQNGGGAPSVINQAIAPPPTVLQQSNGGNAGSNGLMNGHAAAANSSTVQLSPASSISSLSSTNGVTATALPMNGGGGGQLIASPTSPAHSLSQSPPSSSSSSSSKSNYGLITIKGKSNNILATRCVKLLTTTTSATTQQQQQAQPMSVDDSRLDLNGGRGQQQHLQHSSSASAVVNLGILTPATSPRNGHGHVQHQVGIGSSSSSSSSGCSSMESLPLTPVSPTLVGKAEAFVGIAQDLISSHCGGAGGVGGGGGGLMMGHVTATVTGGGMDHMEDHNMSDDT